MRFLRTISCLVAAATVCFAQEKTKPSYDPGLTILDGDASTKPTVLNAPSPEYPDAAVQRRLDGQCTVTLQVDTKGMPRDIKIATCTNPLFVSPSYAAAVQYRFKPATDASGAPIPVRVSLVIRYGVHDGPKPIARITCSFKTPPGTVSPNADSKGVFPLTTLLAPPKMVDFRDAGLGEAAFALPQGTGCDVIVTIKENGRALAPWVSSCDDSVMEKPVIASVLQSRYQAAQLKGQAVSAKVLLHITYKGQADPHQE
jgi:hypothetical protein